MKILIIGFGSIAKKHLKSILKCNPDSIIFAYRTINVIDKIDGIINVFDFDKFNEKIDFIIISNPTALHGSTLLKSIKFNVPIFIEKPVLCDLNLEKTLQFEINRSKLTTYVACNLRFHPALIYIKQFLETTKPRINEVNIYSGSDLSKWRPFSDYKKSYSANSTLGGGVHLDLIHEIDYCLWIFGLPSNVIALFSSKSTLNINSMDSTRYLLEYPKFNVGITLNYFRKDAKRQIEIVTENDTFVIDLISCKVHQNSCNRIIFSKNYDIQDTYDLQMEYFFDCIINKINPMNSFDEGLTTLKIALNEKFN